MQPLIVVEICTIDAHYVFIGRIFRVIHFVNDTSSNGPAVRGLECLLVKKTELCYLVVHSAIIFDDGFIIPPEGIYTSESFVDYGCVGNEIKNVV